MVARDSAMREVLRAIAEHNGEWSWYQLDRAVSGLHPDCVGPFTSEVSELLSTGLIEQRNSVDSSSQPKYWVTECGIVALRKMQQNA